MMTRSGRDGGMQETNRTGPSQSIRAARASVNEARVASLFVLVAVFCCSVYTTGLVASGRDRVIAGDAVHYYVYLRSLVFDRDVDFRNDYALIYGEAPADGRTVKNYMSIGPALVWAPLYLVVTAVVLLASLGGAAVAFDGVAYPFQLAAGYSGIFAATAGAYLSYRACRLRNDHRLALAAVLAVWLGSSAFYYSVVAPAYSHSASILAASLFTYAWMSTFGDRSWRRFVMLGALGGLCALVRWQDGLLLLMPAADLARLVRDQGMRWTEAFGRLVAYGTAAVVVFTPQMIAWLALFGRAFTVPQGSNFLRWGSPELFGVLFSDNHGLFSWTPLVFFCVAGLGVLVAAESWLGLPLLATFVLSVYVNASVHDWWAGEAFGARRFLGCFPVFVLGGAALAARLPRRMAAIGTGALVVANLLLLLQYELFMLGFRDIAPYPQGAYGLGVARFVVPFRLVEALRLAALGDG